MAIRARKVSTLAILVTLAACGGGGGGGAGSASVVSPAASVPLAFAPAKPVSLIIDTDMFSDVDDVGALAIANALMRNGEARILAVMVNTPSRWGAPAVNAINTWYGHGDIPVGTLKPVDDSLPTTTASYPQMLATQFPNSLKDGANAPDAVSLYRQILAQQPDHSVVIVSIGYLSNLAALLKTPQDAYSTSDGPTLVGQKVQFLNLMGGQYPSGFEYNFYSNVSATQAVVNGWPTRIVYNGFEVGNTVQTGSRVLAEGAANNPVRAAYATYLGTQTTRSSWDPISVYTAVRGTGGLFQQNGNGANYVYANGQNYFTSQLPNLRGDAYLVKTADDASITAKLDALLVQAP